MTRDDPTPNTISETATDARLDVRRRGPKSVRNGNALPPGERKVVCRAKHTHRYASGYTVDIQKTKIGEPLRFATAPTDYESLVGLVARATSDHVLLDLNRVLRRAEISMDRPGFLPRLEPHVVARLAPVLGCTVEQVIDLTHAVSVPNALSSRIEAGAMTLLAMDVETERRRISPMSIAQGSHHREAWLLRILPYCPVSHELLRSDCSKCGATLGWRTSVGIGACENCEAIVEPTPSPLLDETHRKDYGLFARLLDRRSSVREPALAELSPVLRQVDGDSIVRLVIGLGACAHLEERGVKRKSIYRLDPADLAAILASGTALLRDWPSRLQDWAREEARALTIGGPAFRLLRVALQKLGRRHLGSPVQVELIRDALPDVYMNERRSFRKAEETLLPREAAAILGIAPRIFDLIDKELLDAQTIGAGAKRRVIFKRDDIMNLRTRIDASISMPLLCRTSGLPIYAVENLCDHELLEREDHAALLHLRHAPSVTIASIDALRARIFRSTAVKRPEEAIPLGTAARRIGGRLKPWAAIVLALADGSLDRWIDPTFGADAPWLRSVLVEPSQLALFENTEITWKRASEYELRSACSLTNAREVLNLQSTLSIDLQQVFAREIAACTQRGPAKSVPMAAVLEKAREEISISEICARADWNPRQAKWALTPLMEARTPCGWNRARVERSGVMDERIDWSVRTHRRAPRRLDGWTAGRLGVTQRACRSCR